MGSITPDSEDKDTKAKGLDLDILPELLGFHVRLANVAISRDFSDAMGDIDLTQKQCSVLLLIGANKAVSQIDLAGTLGTDRSTMMALIARLHDHGLLTRSRSATDGRRQELHLTALGEEILSRAKLAIRSHEKKLLKGFSKEEQKVLFSTLRRIHGRV